jgi:hypothetical protein
MNPLFAAAVEIETFCRVRKWRCCVIGGLALQRWGEPRQTRDVDLTILSGLGGEERFVDPILSHFDARIPDARQFALHRRVLLVQTADGVPLDIALGGLPYEERVIGRATSYGYAPGVDVTTCSAEDLVVLKAFADRPQDWIDIEGILVRQTGHLDRILVSDELMQLLELKGDLQPSARLNALFQKHQ